MNISSVLNDPRKVAIIAGGGGVITGFIMGYLAGRSRSEIDEVLPYVDYVDDDEEDLEHFVLDQISEYPEDDELEETDTEAEVSEEVDETTTSNIFANRVIIEFDEEAEKENRKEGAPYIIPIHVFVENEHDWRQETVTYYVGDDVVAGENDEPIYNYSDLMGDLRFGYGSNDPNVVYIRNEKYRREWEVLRHTGHFGIEVLGHQIESEYEANDLKHSADRKFRQD